MKVKTIELNEIDYKLHLIKWAWKDVRVYLKKNNGDYLDAFEKAEWFCAFSADSAYIYIRNPSINICIHEVTHAIQNFFQTINYINFNEWISEPLAYYIAYYSEEAIKFYLPNLWKPIRQKSKKSEGQE